MATLDIEPRNQMRFAWWGAEEAGLFGSQFYVDQLSKSAV
jgi:Zn-dependent M28 family amino/carboxypeptidase